MTDDPLVSAERAADEQALMTLLRAYESAFNANDARAMNALFADDCVFVTSVAT